ncbi:MAG: tRNA (guanosine(46)-N7)-methyltransferase TrmB [Oscillospiraceae bacterium]|nr:tRNA (guanosine(46)-N7)-methyltransferase TrmB [Oscillospiraceae bacterium]
MRMRRKKWARPELAACAYYIKNGEPHAGRWSEAFGNGNPLHIELGCGKGGFAAELAFQNPDFNIIAVDVKSEMLALARRAVEKKFNGGCKNLMLVSHDIARVNLIFNENDKADVIYINFCNPWTKERHKKRRLTHPRQLEQYKLFLKKGGEIRFKTDDDALFGDSIKYLNQSQFKITFITEDLHSSDYKGNIPTEHEQMYAAQGKKIKLLTAVRF